MLSIIIVNWKSANFLKNCVFSIKKQLAGASWQIIAVNNSPEEDLSELKDENNLTLIDPGKNLGFSTANNVAVQKAKGDIFLFLNPDAEFIDCSVLKSMAYLDSHPEIGALGCRLLNPDHSLQPSVRSFPSLASHILILLKLHRLLKNTKTMKKYLMADFNYGKARQVDQVMGAFFMIKKGVYEKMNGFDEGFFVWYEEVDLCKRLKGAGYQVVYFPETEIIHHQSQSFKREKRLKKQLIFNRSMKRYFKKHEGFFSYSIISLFCLFSLPIALIADIYCEKISINNHI